jgi:hypothetical protein
MNDDLPIRSREEWTRDFWSELVNRSHLLSRLGDAAEVFGWNVRLVWNDGRRGTIYLYDAKERTRRRRERLRFVFTEFEPRREARLLLQQIAPDLTACI